jgi:hypothetical protein
VHRSITVFVNILLGKTVTRLPALDHSTLLLLPGQVVQKDDESAISFFLQGPLFPLVDRNGNSKKEEAQGFVSVSDSDLR